MPVAIVALAPGSSARSGCPAGEESVTRAGSRTVMRVVMFLSIAPTQPVASVAAAIAKRRAHGRAGVTLTRLREPIRSSCR